MSLTFSDSCLLKTEFRIILGFQLEGKNIGDFTICLAPGLRSLLLSNYVVRLFRLVRCLISHIIGLAW